MKKSNITLLEADKLKIAELLTTGKYSGRFYQRLLSLQELGKNKTYASVRLISGLSEVSLNKLAKKYRNEGLKCLYDAPRSGRPSFMDSTQVDKITTLALSETPEGHSQWSLRLLADKAVELKYVDHLSHTQVQKILKKVKSSHI